ncbi:uncharacterized protein LOC144020710 isoform X1 [Festucalex cinctus]
MSDAAESLLETQPLENPEEVRETGDADDQEKAEVMLKGYLQNCEKFYVFSEFLRTEGEGKNKVYTGLAKCMQPGCKNKGVTYTSVSRAHLTTHYQCVHPGKKRKLRAALGENSKRFQTKRRRLSMGEEFCQDRTRSEVDLSQHSYISTSDGDEFLSHTRPLEDPDEVDGDNIEAISELEGYLENCEMFYIFSKFLKTEGEGKNKVYTGLAKCMQPGCKNKGVTYTSVSRAHLTTHYQCVHPGKKAELKAALAGNSRRGRHSEQLAESTPRKGKPAMGRPVREFSQDKAMQMFTRWLVETHSPRSLCEHPYTRELFAYLSPEFRVKTPKDLRRDLDKLMDDLFDLLSKQKDSETEQSQLSDASMSDGDESLSHTQPLGDPEELEETDDTAGAIRTLKKYLHNCEMFYVFAQFLKIEGEGKKKMYTGLARCVQTGCKEEWVTYSTISRANLTLHYQNVHPEKEAELQVALAGNSKRGRPSNTSRLSMEESFTHKLNQDKARHMFTRWFVETLSPLKLCEHPYTRELFSYLSPKFQLVSRKTLRRDLDVMKDKAKLAIKKLLSKQKWVATTADSWTVHNRTFLGMTVHWIDRLSLKRKMTTLACRELKVGEKDYLLRRVIHDVHQEFAIVQKVAAITTDNGANFGEAERKREEVEEEAEEEVLGEPGDVQGRLDGEDADPQITLPTHRRCSVHTLGLMMSVDINVVVGWNTRWRKAIAKARHLWKLQKECPVVANQIKDVVKRTLTAPIGVSCRWNSYLDSVKLLSEVLSLPRQVEAINDIIINQPGGKAGSAILDQDVRVLEEYWDVMKPVADTLNSLQGEDNAYMGILLPTLLVLKRWLQHQQRGELLYARPLVQSLLRGFDKRFVSLFEDQDLLMASALHPSFTPAVLSKIVPDQANAIKDRIFKELKAMVQSTEQQQATQAQPQVKSHQDRVFKELFGTDQMLISQDVDQVLLASIQDWKPQREALSWAAFPKAHREAWVDLFIKYNTPLPSSAAVETMFAKASNIFKPKKAALYGGNFEKLVFLKGNMSLLGYTSYKGQFGEEKQEEEQ